MLDHYLSPSEGDENWLVDENIIAMEIDHYLSPSEGDENFVAFGECVYREGDHYLSPSEGDENKHWITLSCKSLDRSLLISEWRRRKQIPKLFTISVNCSIITYLRVKETKTFTNCSSMLIPLSWSLLISEWRRRKRILTVSPIVSSSNHYLSPSEGYNAWLCDNFYDLGQLWCWLWCVNTGVWN